MTPEEFRAALAKRGVELSDEQMQQFQTYYEFLVATNEHVNLTAITKQEEVYLKHFYDSLLPALEVKDIQTRALSICDVGAGAGFPSIPLKIAFPNLKVTIVDSLNKRIKFLEELSQKLNLTDTHFYHARAEEFAGKKSEFRESFDVVTARAVARLSVLSEFCLPLAKLNGRFIALKAQKANEELADAKYAVATLGGKIEEDIQTALPKSDETRHIIVISKKKPTPNKYPRKPGTPAKQPLQAPQGRK
ncbi:MULTISPECIES: 16S rRNA (guanine(527)-N(7))-methyltransferase RsmG [Ligilactobacillus]|uniref:Ribosomal RNA small subunit methyltransferase G n=1 Tax=Ligilactobacillus animalis TaxID=1605 RepID=A0AAJ6FME9_9LACO|nr:16S rRNA (guanine(527)-N(7))-methyltransferase RsmG [Ligilactobacillus animalis]KDA45724.1 16S rRNA (guanine(527)-N(7))-methyltransferase GidB, gidB [Ligilactobacillus animalis]KRM59890.1 16S rRNA methyltransferase GidB [Ligilactobacillus animalis KCTC 3501 = DSM 20602]MBU5279949.1 16S rRNA (guanine(527)-N(7))-methyltransferase RsmG [Ligilactobacillus animalis]MDO5884247.1 16S rRNA (guanine(527)-N(7))-methyltransferase RsmG [Ligilactobacillus animalis]MDQ2234506.1 16S rRNA (guanine(527)-N(7